MCIRDSLQTVPDAHAGWGIPITRQKTEYEKTSYFKQDGYPAPRPWYPLPGNLSHEIVPTLRAGYVYDHLGALFIHRHSLVDSTPGGQRLGDVLGDPAKINLLVSFDVEIGDTSRFADFVPVSYTHLDVYKRQEHMWLIKKSHVILSAIEMVVLFTMLVIVSAGSFEGAASVNSLIAGQYAPAFLSLIHIPSTHRPGFCRRLPPGGACGAAR